LVDEDTHSNRPELHRHVHQDRRGNNCLSVWNQKLFGWFGGPGIKGTLEQMTTRRIPKSIGWLVIVEQSFGSVALIIAFPGRIAALASS
jgi:hypothetical protein